MITSLSLQDPELDYIGVSKRDIFNSITLEDVKFFLESLGVDQIIVNNEKGYLVCPTICHNPLEEAESMKLYWYQQNKSFHCYTECNENMTIFKLYQKFMWINSNLNISDEEAEEYVKKCLKHINTVSTTKNYSYLYDIDKYRYSNNIPQLEEYPKKILTYFTKYYHPTWLREGITREVMDKFNIGFSIAQNKIIIPHFDIDNRLVGIRARTLNSEEIEEFGKYRPLQIGDIMYTHPLQFNLYGIYEHAAGIRTRRSAIIAEGEKSVLLDSVYYGKYANTVACCGSNFNKYHISLLTDYLGVNEITVAFDKEYTNCWDEKATKYRNKIESMCKKYTNLASFSYIWDYNNLLKEKDSPFDRGKEVFEQLYKTRVKIR